MDNEKFYKNEQIDETAISEQLFKLGNNILTLARNELYIHMRFLDVAFSSLVFAGEMSIDTLGTDGNYLYFNPRYLGALYKKDSIAVNRAYFHMIMHCIFRHLTKANNKYEDLPLLKNGESDYGLWDLACDITAESIADSLHIKSLRMSKSYLRREIYRRLKEEMKAITPQGICKAFQDWKIQDNEMIRLTAEFKVDEHTMWPDSDDQEKQEQLNQKWKDMSEQTQTDMETFSRDAASESSDLLELMKVENRERYDYRQFLKKFSVLREEIKIDPDSFDYSFYSYGLQLYGNMPLIEPQEWSEVFKVEEFVIVIDTSMSCSDELVRKFLEETYGILSENNSFHRKVNIHILQCDDKIQRDKKISSAEDLKQYMDNLELIGKGGTDFRPAFEYVNQMIQEKKFSNLKGLLYFTDGLGTYPIQMPAYDTAFIFMRENYEDVNVPSWAMKIVLDEDIVDS